MRWLLALVAAAAAALLVPGQVFAGGWATTLLDPLPDRVEAGHSYTVGFWILQHGSHVSVIPLERPGLRFDDGKQGLVFRGVPLPEGGHYAAAVSLPHGGDWAIVGMQAPFQDYRVGVLSVPGRFALTATPMPITMQPDPSWATVRPPTVAGQAAALSDPPVSRPASPAPSPQPQPLPWGLLGIGVLAGVAMSAGALAASRRSRRPLATRRPPV
jgi:hypothetical protein